MSLAFISFLVKRKIVPHDFGGLLYLLLCVGSGDEHGLELGRSHIDASVQQEGEILGILLSIGGGGAVVILNGLVRKENAQERAHPVDGDPVPCRRCDGFVENFRFCGDVLLDAGSVTKNRQSGDAGGGGDGVAGESACLIDRAYRGNHIHDLFSAAVSTDWHSAAHDLAEAGKVRSDAVVFLSAAKGKTESGDDLVENQESAIF